MRQVILIFIASAIAGCVNTGDRIASNCKHEQPLASPSGGSLYIGLHHPPMPSGIEDLGGFLVGTTDEENKLGIEYVRDRKGTIILLDHLIYREGCPNPEYLILDFRRVPPLAPNERLVENCRRGDVSEGGDGRTIAIAIDQDSEILNKIRQVWQVDVKTKKLVQTSPVGIQCINEGFGEQE